MTPLEGIATLSLALRGQPKPTEVLTAALDAVLGKIEPYPAPPGCAWTRPAPGWIDLVRAR